MEETGKEKRYSREPEANQIKKRDRRRKKGSLTVEASLVVPLCVMILTFLLSLTFYVYLRCWYTQAACEVSVQGSGYGVLEGRTGQEKAEKKWKTKRSEKITGKVSVWGRPHLEFETKIGQKIIRPVIFVRKVIAFRT